MNLITPEEKNDGKEIAQWNKNLVDIFCALRVKSIEAGSKSSTHFDTKGNGTGLGWDSAKKTIDASEEWWARKLAVIPKDKKFRKEGIYPDFEATLDRMFQRTAATGENTWTLSSRIVPSSIEKDTQPEDNEDSNIEPESSEVKTQISQLRRTKERFQHSGETISRKFEEVLQAVYKMAIDIIQPKDRDFKEVPTKLRNDNRYWPHFKDAIGAIDGTHVPPVEKGQLMTQEYFYMQLMDVELEEEDGYGDEGEANEVEKVRDEFLGTMDMAMKVKQMELKKLEMNF
ncbi:uncharacterized protein [Arachis hypogaea]|uniref:uncharacterized protein n=1 Tax=Arachis hypogaea TaxID=3818 RepID=UPI003B219481